MQVYVHVEMGDTPYNYCQTVITQMHCGLVSSPYKVASPWQHGVSAGVGQCGRASLPGCSRRGTPPHGGWCHSGSDPPLHGHWNSECAPHVDHSPACGRVLGRTLQVLTRGEGQTNPYNQHTTKAWYPRVSKSIQEYTALFTDNDFLS